MSPESPSEIVAVIVGLDAAKGMKKRKGKKEKIFPPREFFFFRDIAVARYGSIFAVQRHPRRISSATPGISMARTSCPSGV